MLAGRVDPEGPYGWHGDEETLQRRTLTGFGIHRWFGSRGWLRIGSYVKKHAPQAEALAAFLRLGLVPPPAEHRSFSAVERRGKDLFESSDTECSSCHGADARGSERRSVRLGLGPSPVRATIGDRDTFRIPSLLFVGHTPPYFHDGRSPSLTALVDAIGDGMGNTSALSGDDRAALAAYLATIGIVIDEEAPSPPAPPAAVPFAARPPVTEGGPATTVDPSTFASDPPADVATPEPSRQEWDAASETPLAHLPDHCRAWRVREWARIQCISTTYTWSRTGERIPDRIFRVALVAGDPREVTLRVENRTDYEAEGVAIFPVRRGDRRFIEIDRRVVTGFQCWKYAEWMQAATFMISESWLPGRASPEIVVSRYGRHPSTGGLLRREGCG
jgi:mono/diheme cytochrome c family protein